MNADRKSTPAPPPSPEAPGFDRYVVVDFDDELRDIPATYAAAAAVDVAPLAAWLREHAQSPLAFVGAGGSLAVAQLGASLHQRATGRMAAAREPMDLYLGDLGPDTAIVLVTAGGAHSDSLAACKLFAAEPRDAAVFCGSTGSAGEALLAGSAVPVFAYDLLPQVHSWVAVNVLVGQALVLARAYAEAFPERLGVVPATLDELNPGWTQVDASVGGLVERLAEVLARPMLAFLHGPDTRTAAVDLDSKFAESGLGELVLSEYRNFAHGRYQTLLPRQGEIAILAMYTPREADIAAATMASIPEHLPAAGLAVPGDGAAAQQIGCLVQLMYVLGALARVRGIEVGWGSRNTFGDLLYDLDLSALLGLPSPRTVS
ncbi:hypothetical protein ACFFX1_37125 [Dactylosporangium sucinum]|uniref:SIS domain-containing protein n=1 Tax=Dactylosporangium sucinum TaxID=1424081 RepID=A0A917X6S6_9ACTN|nr:hypothetical protein [Dactylosporangium sucinum]GGM81328.1 hypothetical protein GCM10007977_098440 [Dactylosporangium sucinum]